jgi:dihydrolipoamide dehydrogenase
MSGPDLVVAGGGPAGVAAALRGRQMGARVVLIQRGLLGGTCVHSGCIPSAAYHTSAGFLRELRAAAAAGVDATAALDWPRVQAWASRASENVAATVRTQLGYAGVAIEEREAAIGPSGADGYEGVPVVVAAGARPAAPGGTLSAESVMGLTRVPGTLHVLGGGRFSLEWADFFAAAGSAVTVVASEVLPGEDRELAEFLQGALEDRGIRFAEERPDQQADAILSADTREPALPGMAVDEFCRTAASGVWAAGDVTGPPWLSNRARLQGEAAAAGALGEPVRVRAERLARSVNTDPELAAVGLTEQQAAARGSQVAVGVADCAASAHAITLGRAAGALKLVVDPEFGEILGGHMVGPGAREVIGQVVLAMSLEADYRDLPRVAYVHPSGGELITSAVAAI